MGRPDYTVHPLLPNLCTGYNLVVVLASAELLAITLALTQTATLQDWLHRLALYTLYVQWIALPCTALLCALHRYSKPLSSTQAGLLAWLLIQVVTLLVSLAAWLLPEQLGLHALFTPNGVLRAQIIVAILSAMLLRYLYIQHLWEQRVRTESAARAEALQSRIRPHFLFNTLNTIAATVHSNPDRADTLISKLCALFRASLHDDATGTLQDELSLCHDYLRLEQERLGDRLQLVMHTDTLPGTLRVPRLILQPLLENAVYHGIEQLPAGGIIQMDGTHHNGYITVRIMNPMPAHPQPHPGHHMALENIRHRLTHRFGTRATLHTHTDHARFSIELRFPASHEDPDR